MDLEEKRFRDAENLLNQSGYTLAEFLRDSSRYKSTLLMLPDDELRAYQKLYADIATGGLSKGEKGKKLEELSTILFQKSAGSLLDVYRNCRLSGVQAAFPCFGDSFLCECKNYDGPVNVTYVGKFSSLMSAANTNFGIMISWEGITGRNKWSDSQGLIKKIALREKRYIIVLDKDDLEKIYKKEESVFSVIYDKYIALKNEIDYRQYIDRHEAEDMIIEKGQ